MMTGLAIVSVLNYPVKSIGTTFMSLCSLIEKIQLNAPVEKVFEFFTDTDQLAACFPPSLGLQITFRTSRHLNQGTSIHFRAKILGIPVQWKSYIHSFSTNRHIAYIWQRGLLTSWEHDYYFESLPNNQTRVTECMLYKVQCGIFGKFANQVFIRPYLNRVLAYRRECLQRLLQETPSEPKSKKQSRPSKQTRS
jgi:ligand-binding SRPBCC domain-containing protein